jgi:eukaryotic-like serine/threonine-protein kinase
LPERYLGRHLGRFRVDSLIGSGGFAWVYKGYDPELDIPVAIKVLKPQYAGEETFETRFRGEASTAAKLRHPNIIRILAVGRQDQAVYFVMDYLPNGLDDRLRMMGTLPEQLLVRMGMDVSAALAFAHREGVIHRDVKTDNILFDEHGNAVVADFGIARAVSGYVEQTGTNMVVGTPQYFSPEQARGQVLDGRADIYSLGVTLFKAATGVLPFQGDDWYEIARQHVEEPPPRPRSLNPALSRATERVILRCLEKSPDARYPSADTLYTELALLDRTITPEGDATVVMSTPMGGVRAAVDAHLPAAMRRHHSRSLLLGLLAGVAAIVLLAFGLRYATRGATPGPDTIAARTESTSTPAVLPPVSVAPPDTDTTTSASQPPAPRPVVQVEAPADAEVRLDGKVIGQGSFRSSEISPGSHTFSAVIPTIEGCPTASDEATVRVREAGRSSVTLNPRPCGNLSIDAQPEDARWVVTSPDGIEVASGTAPLTAPVVLPVGPYSLRVSASYCADYRADLTVTADKPHRERAHLLCDPPRS